MNDASVWAEPLMAMLFSKQTVTAGVGIRSPVRCHGGERGVLSGNVLHVPPKKMDGTCSQKVNLSFKIGENYSTRINLHTTANHKLTFVIYNELQRRAEIELDLHRFIMVPFKHGPQGSNLL